VRILIKEKDSENTAIVADEILEEHMDDRY
jgi:hypothetical protein